MEIKELSLNNNFLIFLIYISLIGCDNYSKQFEVKNFEKVDVSNIPGITVLENDTLLKWDNGVYYFDNKLFSGYIISKYNDSITKSIGSFYEGKRHGITKSFFSNGKLESERNYKNGIGYGKHYGYWKNGNMKFEFIYHNDKREGLQKQWYENGNQYFELTFLNDKENGMQKAWRENGKLYINYESKDGKRYGLQKSKLCFTLNDEKLQ